MRGFTLIELLVVLAIIASLASGLTLTLRPDPARQLRDEAWRLARLFEALDGQAERGQPLWLAWRSDGYRFSDVAGKPPGDPLFAAHTLPDGIVLQQLWFDQRSIAAGKPTLLAGAEPRPRPSADLAASGRRWRIGLDALGRASVTELAQ